MSDILKLSPQAGNNKIIAKIKMDASQPATFLGVPQGSIKKVNKRTTEKKVVTKFRQVKAPQ